MWNITVDLTRMYKSVCAIEIIKEVQYVYCLYIWIQTILGICYTGTHFCTLLYWKWVRFLYKKATYKWPASVRVCTRSAKSLLCLSKVEHLLSTFLNNYFIYTQLVHNMSL